MWERLRDEAVFESEEELIAQIGRDVEATRAAVRPVLARLTLRRGAGSAAIRRRRRHDERLGIDDADRRAGGERVHLRERLAEVELVGLPGHVAEMRRRETACSRTSGSPVARLLVEDVDGGAARAVRRQSARSSAPGSISPDAGRVDEQRVGLHQRRDAAP